MDLSCEEWRDVVGYEGLYQVSSLGRIRSCRRVCNHPNSKSGIRSVKESIVATHGHASLWIGLYRNGRRQKYFVHDIVAQAFLGSPSIGASVKHIDGDKKNNKIENLTLNSSLSQKTKDAVKTLVLAGVLNKDALRARDLESLQAYFSPLKKESAL